MSGWECAGLAARPSGDERPPLGARGCIAKPPRGGGRVGEVAHLGPRRGAPYVPRVFIKRRRDAGGLLTTTAPGVQLLSQRAAMGKDAEAVGKPRRDYRRVPVGTATPRRAWPLINQRGAYLLVRWGRLGRATCGLVAGHP